MKNPKKFKYKKKLK